MIPDASSDWIAKGIARMTPKGFRDFNALNRAIRDADREAIRTLRDKWAGKGGSSWDGAILGEMARAASRLYPVELIPAGKKRYRISTPEDRYGMRAFVGHEEMCRIVYAILDRKAGGCGFAHEIKYGSRHVKTRGISYPGASPNDEEIIEFRIPAIKHVEVSVFFQRVPGEAYAYDLWTDEYTDHIPLSSVFEWEKAQGIRAEPQETVLRVKA
jgi:hypothetical protein